MWRRHHNNQLDNACSDLPSKRGGRTGTVWAAGRCQEARRGRRRRRRLPPVSVSGAGARCVTRRRAEQGSSRCTRDKTAHLGTATLVLEL